MALNASGPISMGGSTVGQSINLELDRLATATINLNEAEVRDLAGVLSGAIDLQDFYGASSFTQELYTWGDNNNGLLGDGSSAAAHRSSPVQMGSIDDWTVVSMHDQAMAVTDSGKLYGWGDGREGAIGNNSVTEDNLTAVRIGALTNWESVSCDNDYSLMLKSDGTAWATGENTDGRLGDNSAINKSSPVQVAAITDFAQISASETTGYGIRDGGSLYFWGGNREGQGGIGTTAPDFRAISSPVQIGADTDWAVVSGGGQYVVAIKTDGTMWSWGENSFGRLGLNLNPIVDRSSPVQIGSDTNWSKVSAGANNCFAVKTDGTLWAWGLNNQGELMQNNTVARSSPVQVGSLTNWSQAFPSKVGNHVVAVKTDGTLWASGLNSTGQLGDGTVIRRSSPVQIGSGTGWVTAAAGGSSSAAIDAP